MKADKFSVLTCYKS